MADFIEIIFSFIYLPIIFSIASFLLYKTIKIKANNLYFISFFFYLTGLDYIFVILDLNHIACEFYAFFNNISLIMLVFFIKYTFYKEKKSPFKIILGLFIVLKIVELILRLPNRFLLPQDETILDAQVPLYYSFAIIVILNAIIVEGWFFYVTFRTYRFFKTQSIAPWVKKRYQLVSYAILCSVISLSLSIFIPPSGGWYQGSPLALSIAFLKLPFIMIFYFGSLLGWVMPAKLKQFLNRNYQEVEEREFSEEELMNIIRDQLSPN